MNHTGRKESLHIHLTYTANRNTDFAYKVVFRKEEKDELLQFQNHHHHPFSGAFEIIAVTSYPFPFHIPVLFFFQVNST